VVFVADSPRLQAVADAIVPGRPFADIGTDHAALVVHAIASGLVPFAVAIDVAAGPLRAAQAAVAGLPEGSVSLRRGSGLTPLSPGEVATAVLAGMGGPLLRRLVDASPAVVAALDRLVLAPNTQWTQTRAWIEDHRWPLEAEALVEEGDHVYLVLAVRPQPGPPAGWAEADRVLGPRLRTERSPVFERWREARIARNRDALARAHEAGDTRRVEALRRELAIFGTFGP
jgi:tRNA (adenine22-N1)-methyltransferase